jgi:hypothetical protein
MQQTSLRCAVAEDCCHIFEYVLLYRLLAFFIDIFVLLT